MHTRMRVGISLLLSLILLIVVVYGIVQLLQLLLGMGGQNPYLTEGECRVRKAYAIEQDSEQAFHVRSLHDDAILQVVKPPLDMMEYRPSKQYGSYGESVIVYGLHNQKNIAAYSLTLGDKNLHLEEMYTVQNKEEQDIQSVFSVPESNTFYVSQSNPNSIEVVKVTKGIGGTATTVYEKQNTQNGDAIEVTGVSGETIYMYEFINLPDIANLGVNTAYNTSTQTFTQDVFQFMPVEYRHLATGKAHYNQNATKAVFIAQFSGYTIVDVASLEVYSRPSLLSDLEWVTHDSFFLNDSNGVHRFTDRQTSYATHFPREVVQGDITPLDENNMIIIGETGLTYINSARGIVDLRQL